MPFPSQKLFVQHGHVKMVQILATILQHLVGVERRLFENIGLYPQIKTPPSGGPFLAGTSQDFLFSLQGPSVEGMQPLKRDSPFQIDHYINLYLCMSNTTTNDNKRCRVEEWFKYKQKNSVHALRILRISSPSRFLHLVTINGIKFQEKGGSISCRPQTTLQFFVLFGLQGNPQYFVMIIGKLYTHYMFVHIWRSTIYFLFGPKWLVPNSCLQVNGGLCLKVLYQRAYVRHFQTKLLLLLG